MATATEQKRRSRGSRSKTDQSKPEAENQHEAPPPPPKPPKAGTGVAQVPAGGRVGPVQDVPQIPKPPVESPPWTQQENESNSVNGAVHVAVPLGPGRDGYRGRQIAIRLDPEQAEILHRVFDGLDATDARLKTGRHVENGGDAIRWMLEQIAGQCDQN